MSIQSHDDSRFRHAITLFNEGDYFESHEVMESLWLEVPKSDRYRDLYKGVIQAAAALLLYAKDTKGAAMRLAENSVRLLLPYENDSFELDCKKMISDFRDWIADPDRDQKVVELKINRQKENR